MTAVVTELRRDVRGRRIAIAAGVAVAASIGVAVASLARSTPEPCQGAGERAAAALPADLRDSTLDALRATAAPLAPRAAGRLDHQLERYVSEGSALRTETCRATWLAAPASPASYGLAPAGCPGRNITTSSGKERQLSIELGPRSLRRVS